MGKYDKYEDAEEAEGKALAEQLRRQTDDYRRQHGFWPPWHDNFVAEPQIVELHTEWLHKRDSREARLERLRELNAPRYIIAKELAMLAEANFVLAITCRLDPTREDFRRRAWEHAQAALAMGWACDGR